MLGKKHANAIGSAKTEAEKVKAAAAAMIETPLDLIRHILQRHEESVIEVMRELDIKLNRLKEDVMTVCPENWREDADWVRLVEAHDLIPASSKQAERG